MTSFTDDEWFERAEHLRVGALTLVAIAGDDALPLNPAARTMLLAVASVLRSEAARMIRTQQVTP